MYAQPKKMVCGLPQVKEPSQVCEECCKRKQTRKAFKHDLAMRSKEKLEIIHSRVCGPFEVRSDGGNYYFLTFIDEFTRYIFIYLIEKNSEVFTQFKKFKFHVKKQSGYKLKKLRTNGGDEYTSQELPRFFNEEEREVIIPYCKCNTYTPQHNGISKRKN